MKNINFGRDVHFFFLALPNASTNKPSDNTKRRDFFKLHLIFWRLKFININKIAQVCVVVVVMRMPKEMEFVWG